MNYCKRRIYFLSQQIIAEKFLMGLLRGKRLALFNTLHVFFIKNRGFIQPDSLSAPVVAAAWQLFRGGVPYVIFFRKLEVKPAQGVPTRGGCCRGSASLPWSQHPSPDLAPHLPAPAEHEPPSVLIHVAAPPGAELWPPAMPSCPQAHLSTSNARHRSPGVPLAHPPPSVMQFPHLYFDSFKIFSLCNCATYCFSTLGTAPVGKYTKKITGIYTVVLTPTIFLTISRN